MLLGILNETKYDSAILKKFPQMAEGWNVSQLGGSSWSLSCKLMLYSFNKPLPCANGVVTDIKVVRGMALTAYQVLL